MPAVYKNGGNASRNNEENHGLVRNRGILAWTVVVSEPYRTWPHTIQRTASVLQNSLPLKGNDTVGGENGIDDFSDE